MVNGVASGMLRPLMFLLLLGAGLRPKAQDPLRITAPVPVADAGFGAVGPRVAALPDGGALVLWGRQVPGPDSLYTARRDPAGNWTAPVTLPAVAPYVNAVEGPQLACGGGVCWVAQGSTADADGYVLRSADGGQSWSPAVAVTPPGTQLSLIAVGADRAGNAHVAYLDLAGAPAWRYTRSADGLSWTAPVAVNAAAPGVACECCWAGVMAGGDTVQVFFRNNDANLRDIRVARSLDGGASFPDILDPDPTDWMISGCPVAGPSAAADADSVYVVFMSGTDAPAQVWRTAYDPATWTVGASRRLFPRAARAQRVPRIDGRGGAFAAVYEEAGGVPLKGRLLASRAGASGLRGGSVALGDSTVALSTPDLAFAGNGWHLVFEQQGQVFAQWASFDVLGLDGPGPAGAPRVWPQPSPDGRQWLEWPDAPATWTLRWSGADGRTDAPRVLHGPGPHRVTAPAGGFWWLYGEGRAARAAVRVP